MKTIKIKDIVYSKIDKSIGKVMSIDNWKKSGPLSQENHGTIEIKIIDPGESTYLEVGDLEHYVLFEWEDSLIIKEQK